MLLFGQRANEVRDARDIRGPKAKPVQLGHAGGANQLWYDECAQQHQRCDGHAGQNRGLQSPAERRADDREDRNDEEDGGGSVRERGDGKDPRDVDQMHDDGEGSDVVGQQRHQNCGCQGKERVGGEHPRCQGVIGAGQLRAGLRDERPHQSQSEPRERKHAFQPEPAVGVERGVGGCDGHAGRHLTRGRTDYRSVTCRARAGQSITGLTSREHERAPDL